MRSLPSGTELALCSPLAWRGVTAFILLPYIFHQLSPSWGCFFKHHELSACIVSLFVHSKDQKGKKNQHHLTFSPFDQASSGDKNKPFTNSETVTTTLYLMTF
ncbi:uncharacterized protein TERG_11940 [Trichophyton rubrum CBS 118892]|uniref:Uncharacterized protein n=1 Tax=Trichophyton rubrum (strain ATCC MYA-4607 / CBS 118892) TaxID=559305 RepID=A0A080WFH9_TRIRC|nr:uncharacterized protein TERG_11940 [Trichophyton rubrum CBS 118892]KFL61056.1 hypothetical protein TERG_11940 [Trichophyton rubrum CBS 118892]